MKSFTEYHEEFDDQARVVTLEFTDLFLLISYNPQGGFTEKSLDFREKWEAAFLEFLKDISKKGNAQKKGIIWAGDFNVNPLRDDWSEHAFDQIRNKFPKGTKPAGCREKDQISHGEMVSVLDGTAKSFSELVFDSKMQARLDSLRVLGLLTRCGPPSIVLALHLVFLHKIYPCL